MTQKRGFRRFLPWVRQQPRSLEERAESAGIQGAKIAKAAWAGTVSLLVVADLFMTATGNTGPWRHLVERCLSGEPGEWRPAAQQQQQQQLTPAP